jgi:general secretion pathway protein K
VKNARGIVLVLVLWVLMVLVVLAGELARSMRIEGLTTDVYQQDVATYYLATAGLHRALYTILRAQQQGRTALNSGGMLGQQFGAFGGRQPMGTPGQQQGEEEEMDVWVRGDGRWKKEEFGEGGYWVRVIDEGGKLNLNTVDELTLRQALTNLNFDMESSQLLVDTIQDWRDTDSLVRIHGAENDYYLSLPIPYPAKDGLFHALEELLLVRGVTPALFYGREGPALRDLFTVYSSGGGVNLVTANPFVLRAVLGVDLETALELVRQRGQASGANLAGLFPGGAGGGRLINFGLPQIVTIESIGYRNDSEITRRVAAIVQRIGVNNFRFLRWQDRVEGGENPPQPQE